MSQQYRCDSCDASVDLANSVLLYREDPVAGPSLYPRSTRLDFCDYVCLASWAGDQDDTYKD